MSAQGPVDDDFLCQAGQHLAGEIDDAGRAAFVMRLRTDLEARQRYRDLLEMDVLLHDHAAEQLSPTARIALRNLPRRIKRERRPAHVTRNPPLIVWVSLAAAVAAVLALVVMQVTPSRPKSTDTVAVFTAMLSGDATVWRAGVPVAGESLHPGDTVVVGSTAELVFPDRSRIELTTGSRLNLVNDQRHPTGVRMQLEIGTARCDLQSQPRGFRLATPLATIAVLGTRFIASATPLATTVAVASGRVRIDAEADRADLVSGDWAEVTAKGIVVTRAVVSTGSTGSTGSAVADFTRADLWIARGPLPVEIGPGHLLAPPELGPPDAANIWRGRSWQWHRPLEAGARGAIAGVLRIPSGSGARDWVAELFCADAATKFDDAEGQPADCIRIDVRDCSLHVRQIFRGRNDRQILWQADALVAEGSEVALGLELVSGELLARVDGHIVWQGAMPYQRALLGIRLTRRRSAAAMAPLEWRTVTCTAP